jgi:hypothetical protein
MIRFQRQPGVRRLRGLAGIEMLPRGSRVQWSGVIVGDILPEWSDPLGPGKQDELKRRLIGQGFNVENLDWHIESWGFMSSDYRIVITVTIPSAYARAEDVFSVIKGDVWATYIPNDPNGPQSIQQAVLNSPTIDPETGRPTYSAAPNNIDVPKDSGKCGQKSGMDWLSCQFGLDSTAEHLGLGVGAGVTLVLVGLVVVGLVFLKK